MKKSRFSDSQIMAILKQAEAATGVPDLCREHGISTATFYKWRSKFGGMGVPIKLACAAFRISEACYRYQPKLTTENDEIADVDRQTRKITHEQIDCRAALQREIRLARHCGQTTQKQQCLPMKYRVAHQVDSRGTVMP